MINRAMLRNLVEAQNCRCFYCNKVLRRFKGEQGRIASADHLHPRFLGGTNDITNIVAACLWCNSNKGCREPTEEELSRATEIHKKLNDSLIVRALQAKQ